MKRIDAVVLLLAVCCSGHQSSAAEPTTPPFDTYSGYFVSNKFEPDAAESFLVVTDQERFDKVFGVAFVMQDTSHRLPKDAFKSLMVVAAIKRGNAAVEHKVEGMTVKDGIVELRYTTTSKKSDTATFACPLIVSIPKGEYKAVQFVENGKAVKKIEVSAPFRMSLEKAKVGELPQGWVTAKTGNGPGSVWKVVEDADGKKVLAQTSGEGPGGLFNLCVADKTRYADINLTVAFKAVAGKLDQGGGPVWRYKDANNYYIARMNPLEDNYRVYKVVGGKRTQLATADVKAAAGKWHTLRVVQKGGHIQCFLNGKPYLDVKDDTFKEAGKIGLWTKADAQTYFADLQVNQPHFQLYTRITSATWPKLKPLAREGDLFWGRQVEGVPAAHRALIFPSHAALKRLLETEDLRDYAAVNLDGEYRDFDLALKEAQEIRSLVDSYNKSHRPVKFLAFYHMRIIDAHPEIVKYPDVVLVGKSYWDAENIRDGRQRSATKYVKLIRDAGREPGILLGSPAKAKHDASGIVKTVKVCLAPPSDGGLGVRIIGFYYERDNVETLLQVLREVRP